MAVVSNGADPRPGGLSLEALQCQRILAAALHLDAWFDAQRQPAGYGGVVVHWWWDNLDFTAPALDWRYEGILIGYLNLWAVGVKGNDNDSTWLEKACRAGDDLVRGQLPSGNFRNSQFEQNPGSGGTPHEVASDLALLRLATCLRSQSDARWEIYAETAERNIRNFYLARLWDAQQLSFRDTVGRRSFVPNKAATLVEALIALSRLRGDSEWADAYAIPTLYALLDCQVSDGQLEGAFYQNSMDDHKVEKYFPYYIARCIPGLVAGWNWNSDERLAQAVRRAAAFLMSVRYSDGSFPQVIYPAGRVNRYPQWVAAVGDIVRGLGLSNGLGSECDLVPSLEWLLGGLLPEGGIATAVGFGLATPFGRADDARDRMSVCGWADKAFRCLSACLIPAQA